MATISVSMIVKNEESCLATALESVKGADEIIVCDTGSTDNTIEIAKSYGAKVYTDYAWADNFAEARNHAADKCTMDLILILDADEVLQEGGLDLCRAFDGTAASFRTKCAMTGSVHNSIRLHKNTPSIRWKGAVHNYLDVEPSHVTGITVTYHYSKSHEYDPDRTLRILEKQTKDNPDSPREWYYLGVEYINKKRPDDALLAFSHYVTISDFPAEKADAYLFMARIHWIAGRSDEARRSCLEAIYINPDFTEALDVMSKITAPYDRLKWARIARMSEGVNVLFKRQDPRVVVTMLCEEDFAGSGYRIVEAVRNAAGAKVDIEQIVMQYGALGHKSGLAVNDIGHQTVQDRINASDVIHFKGDFAYPDRVFNGFTIPDHIKIVYSVGGSFFRRHGHASVAMGKTPLGSYKGDLLTALTPDLIYADNWQWTPHPWNGFKYTWKRGEVFQVYHVPSDPNKKNTQLVNDAMKIILEQRPTDVAYICINGLTPEQALEVKSYAHLYIDQFHADVYGNATIEAMSFGVPVVTWLGDYYPEDCPVVSPIELTAEMLAGCIMELLDWDTLEQRSLATFEYVKKFHGHMGSFWFEQYKQLKDKNHELKQ